MVGQIGLSIMQDFYNPKTGQYFRRGSAAGEIPQGFESVQFGTPEANDYFNSLPKGELTKPIGESVPPTQPTNTLTDPSQFAQAQVGAAVQQPTLPQGGSVLPNLALQSVVPNQLQTTPGLTGTVQAATPTATAAPTIESATIPTASTIASATPTTAPDYTAVTGTAAPQMTAAQGTVTQPMVAAQEDLTSLPPEATVQGQLANISQSINTAVSEGTSLPAFAQGAKRIVDAAMQQRGLGASSIAAEALAQGIISSSIPIAQQDAATYKDAIFANLSNRQQAAVLNAQQYFQMDMANLNNNQQASLTNVQLRQQTLLSDQAASNAALQFNAQSQGQTDQFFSNLSTQINTNNAQRADAMNQYAVAEKNKISAQNTQNTIAVGEANAQRESTINQFNTQIKDQRDKFNVENQRVIEQSNVNWRRSVNTANTASINAANQTDAQNLLNISNFGLSALWQQWRDEASWVNTASQNAQDRAHNLAMAALERESELELLDEASKGQLNQIIGQIGIEIFKEI
tara:strand:+ start:49 stop:1599 length:1551 start_codon:yes stop_codon:yes gene_type:complete